MTGSAAGPLVGANIDTAAVTVRVNTPRSIVHFPTPLAHDPDLPNPGGEGYVTEWAVMPGEACVHSVNSFVASSGGQRDLRSSVKPSCSVTVPVSIPSVAVSVHSFSPLAPASQVSPLRLDQFQTELQHHPDQAAVAYVLSGLREGFRIGFESSMVNLKSASSNMRSSFEHPFVIDSYLQTEVSSGRVAGPFSAPPFPSLHISRFGVIPKNNQPGKWRLILDLSSPVGHSVNDGIPKPPFTVQYVSVDAVIEGIMAWGRGTLMAKFDVASAYRNVAIHPDDRPLLGMQWRGKYFVDLVLPFGLRSAPFIFTSIADLVEWILVHNYGVDFLRYYLDDFFTLGPPSGPRTEKRDRIVALLEEWSTKRFCKRRELESLIGHLHHACKVAPQGRTFLRRMIDLLCAFRLDDHPIRLNQEFRRDLFQTWDGPSFFCMPMWAPIPEFQVSSDAAGSLGYGAIFNTQ